MKKIRVAFKAWKRRRRLKRALRELPELRVVLGASGLFEPGWVPTDMADLNMLVPGDWEALFRPNSISALLAEHVWEHLTLDEGRFAAAECFQYLKPGGYLRIAVPDGNHPDPAYIEYVKVGGSGAGADDHRVLYTCDVLEEMLSGLGFLVKRLEYFDEKGEFHSEDWNPEEGRILRSSRFDERNKVKPLAYTSLILDAFKPESA